MIAKTTSRFQRDVAKWEKSVTAKAEKVRIKRLHDQAWKMVSAKVSVRDAQTCRVCHCQTTRFGSGNPKTWGMAHHIVFRSAGGSDELSNLVWVDYTCHEAIHAHRIDVSGTADKLHIVAIARPA